MFTRLRLRLTALYLAATLGFLLLIGAITYGLLNYYFQSTTDLALRYKMAYEYALLGMPMPAELETANREWQAQRGRDLPASLPRGDGREVSDSDDAGSGHELGRDSRRRSRIPLDNQFDSELSAVFVLSLDAQGRRIISDPATATEVIEPDPTAVQAAMQNGSDIRTIQTADGTRVRVLTYALPTNNVAALLQVGRPLDDQNRIMRQLLIGLLAAGGIVVALSTVGSWWLAGRSLRPMQLAWERQREFVANASHELRTPLSLIQLSSEIAQRSDISDDERRELAGDVVRETHYMTQLVGDLLLLSRLDSGQLELDMRTVSMPDLLSKVQREMSRLADAKDVTLRVVAASGVAIADETRLRQVLLGLIDNALRFTPKDGLITLESKLHGNSVQIIIADTGSGIAPEQLPRVFDRFYRVDTARKGRGNAGLGLSIAKSLVEALHGHISIVSQLGRGTQVTITLRNASQGP